MLINKKRLIVTFLSFLVGCALVYIGDHVILGNKILFDRYLLFYSIVLFISIHFYFDVFKIWNFIFKKRYIIGVLILTFFVANGYHGSSVSVYEDVIQPSLREESNMPFLGSYQIIRSDEFLVNTPSALSQAVSNEEHSKYNDALMGKDSLVTLFPGLPNYSLSTLLKPASIGYLILPLEQAYSLAWYLPYFLLFFGLFEFFRIITNDKRGYSLFGTLLVVGSPGTLWWGVPTILLYGILATLCLDKFLKSSSWKGRLLFSALLGWMGSCYIATVYPAWQVPYGYLFLVLFVWLWIKNKKSGNWKNQYFSYILVTLLVITILFLPVIIENISIINLTMNTVYPGARSSSGNVSTWQWFYTYIPSLLYPIKEVSNASEFSQIISLYPIPIIMGGFYSLKNFKEKKHDLLLNLLVVVTIFLSIWNYVDIGILAKISLLSFSTPQRSQIVVSVISAILLIYILANYNNKVDWKKVLVSSILSACIVFIGIKACDFLIPSYMSFNVKLVMGLFYLFIIVCVLLNHRVTKNIFISIMTICLIFQILTVLPITRGLGALYDKPFYKEIDNIVENDENALWITVNAPLHMQSSLLANGARVLNSTNYYPNFDFWYEIDEEKEYEDIYNRYSHISMLLTEENSSMELLSPDHVKVNLNVDELQELNVSYIASADSNLEVYSNETIGFEQIYGYENAYIYALKYEMEEK